MTELQWKITLFIDDHYGKIIAVLAVLGLVIGTILGYWRL